MVDLNGVLKSLSLILFTILFFSSCSLSKESSSESSWKEMTKIVKQHAKESRDEDSLILIGSGQGSIDCYKINLHYWVITEVKVDQAREIYFRALDKAVALINSSEAIRPFLTNYPATESNVHLIMAFYSEPNKEPPPGYVAFITKTKNKIIYSDSINNLYRNIHIETIEEAREKLRDEMNSMDCLDDVARDHN